MGTGIFAFNLCCCLWLGQGILKGMGECSRILFGNGERVRALTADTRRIRGIVESCAFLIMMVLGVIAGDT